MSDNIFNPVYSLTPSIERALSMIDNQRWLFANMLLMPKHQAWMHRDVRAERAAGTTSIEGVGLDKSAVGELIRRGTSSSRNAAERANLNAHSAYEFIDYLSDQQDIPLNELVIRQLNREFLSGESEALTPGVYRRGQNAVGNFMPPNQGDVPALMRSLADWLGLDHGDIHPIVKASLAHIQLVAIHPFWDGNGRVARGLATLVLQRSDFHFGKLLSLESNFAAIKDEYITAIERTLGTQFQDAYDATKWVEFFTARLVGESMKLITQLTGWHRMMAQMHEDFEKLGLSGRQTDGLAYAMRVGRITRRDYMEITKASGITASRDLAALAKTGLLRAEGKTRSRFYVFQLPRQEETETPPLGKQAQLPLETDE